MRSLRVYYPLPSSPSSRAHAVVLTDHGDGTSTIEFSNRTTKRVPTAELEPRL